MNQAQYGKEGILRRKREEESKFEQGWKKTEGQEK